MMDWISGITIPPELVYVMPGILMLSPKVDLYYSFGRLSTAGGTSVE